MEDTAAELSPAPPVIPSAVVAVPTEIAEIDTLRLERVNTLVAAFESQMKAAAAEHDLAMMRRDQANAAREALGRDVQARYKLGPEDRVDLPSGKIVRAPK